jgi:DNA-binding XRE family transcriptional regulator
MTVTYHKPMNPARQEWIRKQRRERGKEYARIMADPVLRHEFEKNEYETGQIRRLQKMPQHSDKTRRQLRYLITGSTHQEYEPIILSGADKKAPEEEKRPQTRHRNRVTNRRQGESVQRIERNAEAGDYRVKYFTSGFVDRVKRMRLERPTPLTQEDVAKLVNVTPNEIAKLERGELEFDNRLKTLLLWKLGSN